MAEIKTKPTDASPAAFLAGIADERRRADAQALLDLFSEITGETPRMWGPAIIGFGEMRFRYASGREVDWFVAGFAPRKQNFSLYFTCDIARYAELLEKLGRYKTGKGCLYINRLADVNQPTLRQLLKRAVRDAQRMPH